MVTSRKEEIKIQLLLLPTAPTAEGHNLVATHSTVAIAACKDPYPFCVLSLLHSNSNIERLPPRLAISKGSMNKY
jgi:hypothetical protein